MSRRLMLFVLPLLWIAVLASSIVVVHSRHRARSLFIELEQLSAERDRLNIEGSQLQLEQSSWSNPLLVERVADNRRKMRLPQPDEIVIVSP